MLLGRPAAWSPADRQAPERLRAAQDSVGDDPVYGARGVERGLDSLMLGALDLRGERGVFGVPMDLIMRLRHNPFFPYVEARIMRMIETIQ